MCRKPFKKRDTRHFLAGGGEKTILIRHAMKSGVIHYYYYYYYYYYYRYSAFGPVLAETRAQSGDWYGSGMLHPGQVLRGSLPLLSPIH